MLGRNGFLFLHFNVKIINKMQIYMILNNYANF